MKRLAITMFAIVAILLAGSSSLVAAHGTGKVTICHVPPGNPGNAHTITISENALKAHLGSNAAGLHGGDYYGQCREVPTSTPTSSPEPSATPKPSASVTPSPKTSPTPPEQSPSDSPNVTPTPKPSETPSTSSSPTLKPSSKPTPGRPVATPPPTDTEPDSTAAAERDATSIVVFLVILIAVFALLLNFPRRRPRDW